MTSEDGTVSEKLLEMMVVLLFITGRPRVEYLQRLTDSRKTEGFLPFGSRSSNTLLGPGLPVCLWGSPRAEMQPLAPSSSVPGVRMDDRPFCNRVLRSPFWFSPSGKRASALTRKTALSVDVPRLCAGCSWSTVANGKAPVRPCSLSGMRKE